MGTLYMNHEYLVQTEAATVRDFDQKSPGFEAMMLKLLDVLFRLTYFVEHRKPAPEDGVHYFIFERCVRLPYSLRATWLLARCGYYPEAAILVRHLLETFVQLRYFVKHPGRLVAHFTSGTQKGKIRFRPMFEDLAPGYYDKYCGVLATVAHAGSGLSALSGMEQAMDGTGKMLTPLGCKLDRDHSSLIVNHTLMLISGYLRCFPAWFPSYRELADAETEIHRTQALARLDDWRRGHKATYPESQEWHERSDSLMGADALA